MTTLFPAGGHGIDERAGFLAAIRANPADDVPRLIYADWLQEHGEEDRAELIRLQVERFRLAAVQANHVRWSEIIHRIGQLREAINRMKSSLPPNVGGEIRRGFVHRAIGLWRDWVKDYPALTASPDVVLESVRLRSCPTVAHRRVWRDGKPCLRARWVVNPEPLYVEDDGESSLMKLVGHAFLDLFARDFPGHCGTPIRVEWTNRQSWLTRCVLRATGEMPDVPDRHRASRPQPPTPLFGGNE